MSENQNNNDLPNYVVGRIEFSGKDKSYLDNEYAKASHDHMYHHAVLLNENSDLRNRLKAYEQGISLAEAKALPPHTNLLIRTKHGFSIAYRHQDHQAWIIKSPNIQSNDVFFLTDEDIISLYPLPPETD